MTMHRSTRIRRLAVAFIVVLVLAVATRFARASSAVDGSIAPELTLAASAPFAARMAPPIDDFVKFSLPRGRA